MGDIDWQQQLAGSQQQQRYSMGLNIIYEQCHVYSWCRRLDTDLLVYISVMLVLDFLKFDILNVIWLLCSGYRWSFSPSVLAPRLLNQIYKYKYFDTPSLRIAVMYEYNMRQVVNFSHFWGFIALIFPQGSDVGWWHERAFRPWKLCHLLLRGFHSEVMKVRSQNATE